ncbi:hypothetical protein [Kribbella sp. NPDC055071]
MEHSNSGTPSPSTSADHAAPSGGPAAGSTRAERQARADWLIAELGRRAAASDSPAQQLRLRRTADSLVRLAIAFRS